MRDPNRISEICALLEAGWKTVPDIRLGQLIENLKRYIGKDDIFYVEDDDMLEYLKDYFGFSRGNEMLHAADEICPACGAYSVDGDICAGCIEKFGLEEVPLDGYNYL